MKLKSIFFYRIGAVVCRLLSRTCLIKPMREWLGFLSENKRILDFGFLFNFFSSFGQTFFISLFVPVWMGAFGISNAFFGAIYSLVTVASALALSFFGKYIDRMPLKKFGLIVFSSLIFFVLLLSAVQSLYLFVFSLFFVRWLGQGLMTHTSETGMAKHFIKARGKALGYTSLGHPAAQLVLPLLVVPMMGEFGWRQSLVYLCALASLITIPVIFRTHGVYLGGDFNAHEKKACISDNSHLKSPVFWIIAFNSTIIPFTCTAVFLYQIIIAESRGWTLDWMAFSFAFYAIFNAVSIPSSGQMIDRYCARMLFPLYLFPALAAYTLLSIFDNFWFAPVFYALLGISTGMGSPVKTAIQAEIFGTRNLGRIRSHIGMITVLSTASSPPLFGTLLDMGYSSHMIILGFSALTIMAIALSFKVGDL